MMRLLATILVTAAVAVAQTYIFVDDSAIARKEGVRRSIHAGRKLPKPVLEPERPWEGQRIYTYGTILYDSAAGQFRMWYCTKIAAGQGKRMPGLRGDSGDLVLYAVSKDGVEWERPNLGLYEFDGSRVNNIVYDFHSPSVWRDDDEKDPERRFKMVGVGRGQGKPAYAAAFSPDGLRWKDAPANPIIPSSDTITLTRNPESGEFLAYHKWGAEIRGYPRRTVWLSTSKDFVTWSKARLVLAPDEKDDEWVQAPPQRTEFYVMSAAPYAGQYLGLVSIFRLTALHKREEMTAFSPGEPPSPADGPIDIQLAYSRDGWEWKRLDERKPVIPLGPAGSYDAGCILGVSNLLTHGDEIWVYYTAITTTHGGDLPAKRITIGRSAWRLDGFVSLDADANGVIETVPLPIGGKKLTLNAEAAGGNAAVEVVGARGFAKADCQPLRGNGVRQAVRWKGGDRLPPGGPVKLRIHLSKAKLYALRAE